MRGRGFWAGRISAVVCGLALGVHAGPAAVDVPLLVTQVPREGRSNPAATKPAGLVEAAPLDHARLVVWSAAGKLRVLTEGFASACDPDVSFDGQRVLFAGRKEENARWRIWEVGVDGQGLRPVSPEDLDARMPIHVSTLFTLDSPEPWFTTVFVGREPTLNEGGQTGGSSLYNLKLDGTQLRRLTFTPNHNLDPFQMWDGRVLYAAETYPQEPGAGAARVGLHAIHVEGADREFYGGGQGRRIQRMPCACEGGLVVFVESDEPGGDGSGQLACVAESRPTVSCRRLTDPGPNRFLHPAPLRGDTVLVARRPAGDETTFGIVTFDADTGQCEPVFDSPDFHEVQAKPLRPRPRPDGHSTVVNPKFDTGVFYGMNVYTADPGRQAPVKSGEIRRVRFIEGVLSTTAPPAGSPSPWPVIDRRLVGEAPVEMDGSFNVEVPADTPLLLQTLDERDLALGTCGWIWVKPKETRGCIGCHEDPELVPENEYVLALRRPSNHLALPPAQRRTVTFREQIAPLMQRHCATAECHGGTDTPLRLALTPAPASEADLRAAYTALLAALPGRASAALPHPGKYVDAGRARTSWLAWQLLGTKTSRPWDLPTEPDSSPVRKVNPMPPPAQGPALSAETVRSVIQWIDLGAQYTAKPPFPPPVAAMHPPVP